MKHTDDMKKAKDFINRTDDKHVIHQEMPDGYADNIGQLRLLVLQILKHIWDTRPANMPHILYLTKVQTSLAKKLHDMLMQDLSQHISIHSIPQTLRVSETSLKRYFFCVYGMNVSSYMNEMRMKYAAELLAKSNQNISDIAKSCGYVNQGRFACIFRKFYGAKPLDYRRNSKLKFMDCTK